VIWAGEFGRTPMSRGQRTPATTHPEKKKTTPFNHVDGRGRSIKPGITFVARAT